ncbi:phage-related baseplate assembly protein [Rhodoblastus sphagnicola]|nr:baseplate J/gp47 family protein [Rhodoblastus sphagnicola]MBB4199052.1 phage-related baseplate assembly protein [Rhodoblastus sphagnicola]
MYQTINLAALPTPSAVSPWSFQAILDATLSDASARLQAAGIAYNVNALKGNPLTFVLSAYAYREGLMIQRINEAAASTFLASAVEDSDVDLRAADVNIVRAMGESNASLKQRAQLAWEALATGGTSQRYQALALSVSPTQIADVAVYGHETTGVPVGAVWIYCLGSGPSGVASADVLAAVLAACSDRAARPVNDSVSVFAATPLFYTVEANLVLETGADPLAVVAARAAALKTFCADRATIGNRVTPNQIAAVLAYNAAGLVNDVTLARPGAAIGGDPFAAPILAGVNLTWSRRGS